MYEFGGKGFHLYVLAVKLYHAVGHEQIRKVGFKHVYFLEVDFTVVAAREEVGLETPDGKLVGQAHRGLPHGERAVVGYPGCGEVEADGQ